MPLWLKAVICIVIVEVLGSASGLLTLSSIKDWYSTLERPPGTPPNWVFGPAWTLLYAMIGTALALVWHRAEPGPAKKSALSWFGVQFALNLAWTPVFFGAHALGAALVIIACLFGTIVGTIRRFQPLDRIAAALMVPYLCWVGYATYLNAGYWWLNKGS